ncbi:response regulator transcription factor [Horticoccus sp. 23ND18S-11]|uniref:response regulator transcription factor n=1 Tax=Horticoccus sp. 23ND18S-11 TaxID=3391832 RepID=UPI0039C9359B
MTSDSFSTVRAATVLLVDDVPENLDLLIDTLRGAGHEIRVAESGERALKQLPLVKPELILLDVMLPGLSGFETCRRIKADAQWRDVPVIFVTALSDVAEKVRGFEAGGVDYLTKPFHPQEVLARVTAHLQLAALRRELARKNAELQEEITLRLEAERQLHQSLDRAVLVATREGQIVFHSRPASQLLARFFPDTAPERLPGPLLAWVNRGGSRPPEVLPELRARLFAEPGTAESFVLLLEDLTWQPKLERLLALGLTPREAEVLYWFVEGKGAPEIAVIVGVSHNTIRKHAQSVLEKLGVENRTAAVRIALEHLGRAS